MFRMTEEKLLLLTINFQDIENMVKMNQMSQKNCIFDIIVVDIFLNVFTYKTN